MSRLTRDGTAEPVSRDQILRHERGQGKVDFPCSADHEQNWQPYPVDHSLALKIRNRQAPMGYRVQDYWHRCAFSNYVTNTPPDLYDITML